MKEITVNWHIIEKCNYSCHYCFAEYRKSDSSEIHLSKNEINLLLKNVFDFFVSKYSSYTVRLNIAGGEPTLSKNLDYIIQRASLIGFRVSLISNGSMIDKKFIENNAKYLNMFAISLDSLTEKNNSKIGRISKKITLEIPKIIEIINFFRIYNEDLVIKVNTVVNQYNYREDLRNIIEYLKPDKWKIFQALSINNDNTIFCTDEQYKFFLNFNKEVNCKIFSESNDEMTDSYIMIDPIGRFYQNTNSIYSYSDSILNVNVKDAFDSINFDYDKFMKRYE